MYVCSLQQVAIILPQDIRVYLCLQRLQHVYAVYRTSTLRCLRYDTYTAWLRQMQGFPAHSGCVCLVWVSGHWDGTEPMTTKLRCSVVVCVGWNLPLYTLKAIYYPGSFFVCIVLVRSLDLWGLLKPLAARVSTFAELDSWTGPLLWTTGLV